MQESSPGSQSQEEPLQPTQANPKNPEDEAAPKKKKKENEKSPTTTPVQLLTSTLRLPAGSKELADKTAASTENAALPEQSANGEQRTQTSEGGNDKSSHAKDKDAATQEQPTRFKQKKGTTESHRGQSTKKNRSLQKKMTTKQKENINCTKKSKTNKKPSGPQRPRAKHQEHTLLTLNPHKIRKNL